LPHGSVVIFAFKDSFTPDELILENPTQARRTGTFLIWFGEYDSTIPDAVSQINSNFCNAGSIKLPIAGTNGPINQMIVDPIVMWNVRKPSNLPDYMSLCYGISDYEDQNGSVAKKDWKNSCHYGVIDDEEVIVFV